MNTAKTLYRGKVAKEYDRKRFGTPKGKLYGWCEKNSIKRAMRLLPKGSLVLDIPCGTGRVTKYLYDLGYNMIGADISEDMLDIARLKVATPFVRRAIEATLYADKSFDAAVCLRMMGYLSFSEKIDVLKELKRIANHLIVTFYFKSKLGWYEVSPYMLENILEYAELKVISKHHICPGWSDGITYLLHE